MMTTAPEMTSLELVLPTRPLQLEQLPFLDSLGRLQGDRFILEKSIKGGYSLRTPISIKLDTMLGVGEKGLVEYVIRSLISQRPSLIPWTFENESVLRLARYMLRSWSGSLMGFYGYVNTVDLYCRRLNTSPDQIIADVKPDGAHVDPDRLAKHQGFLAKCAAELQDNKRSPGRIHGYVRQVRSFYRCNGVELPKLQLPRDRVVSKDRAPTPEELQKLVDVADPREKVIVTMLALTGLREGTFSVLRYKHVREDLEKGVIPVHIHVSAEETKGKYGDYDTFLGQEAVDALRLHLEQRRRGTLLQYRHGKPSEYMPPEEVNDESPLIRDVKSAIPRAIGEKAIYKIIHNLYHRAGLLKQTSQGGYDLRAHSLRKYFKTQMISLGVDSDYVDYMMGHVLDTYHDVQSKGVDYLRNIYAKADLRIRPKAPDEMTVAKRVIKQLIQGFGPESAKALFQEALAEPQMAYVNSQEREEEEIQQLTRLLIQRFREAQNSLGTTMPPDIQR